MSRVFKFVVDWLVGVKTKLIAFGVAALIFAGWILKLRSTARKEGEAAYAKKIDKETKKVENAWTKIDRAPSTVDASLGRLRKRSSDSGHGPAS